VAKEYLIRLPWPDRRLNGHAKGSKWPKIKATKSARETACWLAKAQSIEVMPDAHLHFTYAPPDRRRRDVQNMPAMVKAYIDGIADAMGCDDNGFRPHYPSEFDEPVKDGAVLVHVMPGGRE
jgi:crossover junction endodeoxyribonuclease RusA